MINERGAAGRRLMWAMRSAWLLPICAGSLAADAEYAIRWTQAQPLDDAARARLVALLNMSNLKPTECFTVQYPVVKQQPAALQAMGDLILRVRTRHAGANCQPGADDKVETTLKYRGAAPPTPSAGSCPFGSDRYWEGERDVTWLPPWRPEVLQAIAAERKLALKTAKRGWPRRERKSVACDIKQDSSGAMPAGWVVAPAPCGTTMRRTEAKSDLRIEEWADTSGTRPTLVEVSLKVKEDTKAAREQFTRDVALPLMAREGVVPEIENKTELSSCR